MIDHDIRSGWFIAHWISSITRQTSNREPILILFTRCNTKIIKKHTRSQIAARFLALSLSLLFLLFVTDECECARSSRRWWWWCVRMKQFQVSKKQSEVANEQTSDEKEKKIHSDWLWSHYNNTHAEKYVYLRRRRGECVPSCARLYMLLGSWLGLRAHRATLYHFMLFSIYFFCRPFRCWQRTRAPLSPFSVVSMCACAHIRLCSYSVSVCAEAVALTLIAPAAASSYRLSKRDFGVRSDFRVRIRHSNDVKSTPLWTLLHFIIHTINAHTSMPSSESIVRNRTRRHESARRRMSFDGSPISYRGKVQCWYREANTEH